MFYSIRKQYTIVYHMILVYGSIYYITPQYSSIYQGPLIKAMASPQTPSPSLDAGIRMSPFIVRAEGSASENSGFEDLGFLGLGQTVRDSGGGLLRYTLVFCGFCGFFGRRGQGWGFLDLGFWVCWFWTKG